MKINKISVFQKTLPLSKPYYLSGGRLRFESLDSTFVRVQTDAGITGWGEACPWGNTYLPAFGGGVRAAAALLAAALLGGDPRRLDVINRLMDTTLPGHLYAKSPFDIACWDVFGQAAGLPLADMLGGAYPDATPIVSSISTDTPEHMLQDIQRYRNAGYFCHSVKIGGGDVDMDIERIRHIEQHRDRGEVIVYDLNRSWQPAQAITVMNQTRNIPAVFEQPCETLQQCLAVRENTTQPLSIDENLQTPDDLNFIVQHRVGEIVNIKIGRVGGLTRARRLRDAALAAGLRCLVMETGGSVVADTAAQHLAQSVPPEHLIGTWLSHDMLTADVAAADAGARNHHGKSAIPAEGVGLGVQPDEAVLTPIAEYQ